MKELVNAQNAQLNVNGIDIERSSNKITDAPQGVTLDLTKKSLTSGLGDKKQR